MADFAKLFDTKYGQVLITNDTQDDAPCIHAFFNDSGALGVSKISTNFPENDFSAADKAFDSIDAEKAVGIVEPTILFLRRNLNGT